MMRLGALCRKSLLVVCTALLAHGVASGEEQIFCWNFDWDDNVAYMPAKVYLYHRDTGEERAVSTRDFTEIQYRLGKPGEWEAFRTLQGRVDSFRDLKDAERQNRFLHDVRRMLAFPAATHWQGPSWLGFAQSLARPETARWTFVLTPRGHSSGSLLEGLRYLQSQRLLAQLPPERNLLSAAPEGGAFALDGSRLDIFVGALDRLESTPLGAQARPLRDADGEGFTPLHVWGYSDDDLDNIEKVATALGEFAAKGRWPHVKIVLLYTGTRRAGVGPHALVLRSSGERRAPRPGELEESGEAWKHFPRLPNELGSGQSAPARRPGQLGFQPPVPPRP